MLSKKEKKEMLSDGKSRKRREWFRKTKPTVSKMTFEKYIDFLDQNQGLIPSNSPAKITITTHNKL